MRYVPDVLTVVGLGLLIAGIALVYVPAAVIVAGLILVVCARQLERLT